MKLVALLFGCCTINAIAQTTVVVPMPTLLGNPSERVRVYVDTNGNDVNPGTRSQPIRTFSRALVLLKQQTEQRIGRVACAVRYMPGRHMLTEAILQQRNDHEINGQSGRRWLEISVEGEDSTTLDASNIPVLPGHGVITLCGSGITIEKLRVYNSPVFGIRLGQPNTRSTNVLIKRVVIDSTFSHGILIGDPDSFAYDTVALVDCRVRATNLSNEGGTQPQFGSAIKLFGARYVTIKNCGLERNWGEAISVNYSQRVDISDTWILDNWGVGVYADIASDVRVHGCLMRSTGDTTVFAASKRGMVGVLCSNEAFSALITDYRTERIDIFNNVMLNLSGFLDLWEGAVSFLQRGTISGVRFAHNTCVGLSSGNGNTNALFVNVAHSQPKPPNRVFEGITVANNVFTADTTDWPALRWVRFSPETESAFNFLNNSWKSFVPLVGEFDGNDVDSTLPTDVGIVLWPEVTSAFKRSVPKLSGIDIDARGVRRRDATNVGAFELPTWASTPEEHGRSSAYQLRFVHGSAYTIDEAATGMRMDIYAMDGRLLRSIPAHSTRTATTISWNHTMPVMIIFLKEHP